MQQIDARTIRLSRLRPALGTFVAFEADAATLAMAEAAIADAAAAVAKVQTLLHPTHPGSDLLAIARATAHAAVEVDPWTFELLLLSQSMHQLSDGIFDPCLPCAVGRFGDLELRPPHSVIAHHAVCIDLGGIAKGFAVDRAIDAMRERGCSSAQVNAGGDLRVAGDRRYEILLRLPAGESRTLRLSNTALAVSSLQTDDRPAEHRGYYRRDIASTVQLAPVSDAAAILAPSAAVADALTKCALLGSPQKLASLLRHLNATRVF